MASKPVKYTARAVAVGGLALAAATWATSRTLEDQGASLCAAGLAFLIFAPTLPQDWRAPFYALGVSLLLAGVGVFLVALNADERAALGTGVHDGRTTTLPTAADMLDVLDDDAPEVDAELVPAEEWRMMYDFRGAQPPWIYRLSNTREAGGGTLLSIERLRWIGEQGGRLDFAFDAVGSARFPPQATAADARAALAPLVSELDQGAEIGSRLPDALSQTYLALVMKVAAEEGVDLTPIDWVDFQKQMQIAVEQ